MACFTGHLKAALLIAGLLILFGCTNNRATHNEILVQVSIEADPEMNPDINQRASPAELHIYFLNSPTLFQEQDYYNLIDSPEQALKHDFVSRNSLIITPGQQLQTTLKTPGSYQHAGVIASFRDLNKSQWRAITNSPRKNFLSSIWPERWQSGQHKRTLFIHANQQEVSISEHKQ